MVFRVTNEHYGFKLAILPGKVDRLREQGHIAHICFLRKGTQVLQYNSIVLFYIFISRSVRIAQLFHNFHCWSGNQITKAKPSTSFFLSLFLRNLKKLLVIDKLDHIWIQLYTTPLERFSVIGYPCQKKINTGLQTNNICTA